mmetsp:Transcript_62905/g.205385  ORF Transcript_62905/g.205385 Transcript_62905/m.205385 type:complete len:306 (-) Transcript_62905:631-1548(-)
MKGRGRSDAAGDKKEDDLADDDGGLLPLHLLYGLVDANEAAVVTDDLRVDASLVLRIRAQGVLCRAVPTPDQSAGHANIHPDMHGSKEDLVNTPQPPVEVLFFRRDHDHATQRTCLFLQQLCGNGQDGASTCEGENHPSPRGARLPHIAATHTAVQAAPVECLISRARFILQLNARALTIPRTRQPGEQSRVDEEKRNRQQEKQGRRPLQDPLATREPRLLLGLPLDVGQDAPEWGLIGHGADLFRDAGACAISDLIDGECADEDNISVPCRLDELSEELLHALGPGVRNHPVYFQRTALVPQQS